MILTSLRVIAGGEINHLIWSGLSRFQNVSFTAERIHTLQQVSKAQSRNVRKQAEQIRYCLIQAREYFSAARSVTSATKPVLLYYGLMSLAIAEVLMKQTGDSSIDRARAQHSHHGLTLVSSQSPATAPDLLRAAGSLVARPHCANGTRSGTFELWHRSSRETPLCGKRINQLVNGVRQETFSIIAGGADRRMELLPKIGLSLLDCLRVLPSMKTTLEQQGILPHTARGRLLQNFNEETGYYNTQIIFHPYHPSILSQAYEKFEFSASSFEQISIIETGSGCIVSWAEKPPSSVACRMPNAFQENTEDIEFCLQNDSLTEFGIYYIALYILGNYARYYPEQWMVDVERSTPLSLAAHELMAAAEVRVPLLALAEISQVWHLLKV